jgi:hypothetical protein
VPVDRPGRAEAASVVWGAGVSDPRLTPEELERIAEMRRRILERHPDADEVNARVRAALTPAPPTFTATERKEATRQALALLTASFCDDPDGQLIGDLIGAQGLDLPLVTVSVVGLASGLLRSFDDEHEGAARCWLESIGQRVEAMPEGDE